MARRTSPASGASRGRPTPARAGPPGGERVGAGAARVGAARGGLLQQHGGQTVVLATHAVVGRLIVLAALGLGPDRLWSGDASPAGITEIEYQDGWVTVHRMNTLTHLDGEPSQGSPDPSGEAFLPYRGRE